MKRYCLHSWKHRAVALIWSGGRPEYIRYKACALCGTVLL